MTVRAAAGIMATMSALLVLACTSFPKSAPDAAGSDADVDTDAVSAACAMQADNAQERGQVLQLPIEAR
jgi:hypothetical protein